MRFNYKLYPDHKWEIIADDELSLQVYCNECKYRVTNTIAIYSDDGIPDSSSSRPVNYIVNNQKSEAMEFGHEWFQKPIEEMDKFFEQYSCNDLIIKNIIE